MLPPAALPAALGASGAAISLHPRLAARSARGNSGLPARVMTGVFGALLVAGAVPPTLLLRGCTSRTALLGGLAPVVARQAYDVCLSTNLPEGLRFNKAGAAGLRNVPLSDPHKGILGLTATVTAAAAAAAATAAPHPLRSASTGLTCAYFFLRGLPFLASTGGGPANGGMLADPDGELNPFPGYVDETGGAGLRSAAFAFSRVGAGFTGLGAQAIAVAAGAPAGTALAVFSAVLGAHFCTSRLIENVYGTYA